MRLSNRGSDGDTMNNVNDAVHAAHLKFQRQQGIRPDGDGKPSANVVKFVEPTSDQWIKHHRTMLPCGVNPDAVSAYYRMFCAHDKPYWATCNMCNRTQKEAKRFRIK